MSNLFRGKHYGVFRGASSYYVAQMAADGISHHQPEHYGVLTPVEANDQARAADAEAAANEDRRQAAGETRKKVDRCVDDILAGRDTSQYTYGVWASAQNRIDSERKPK